jgi:hypothetical protein
MENLKELKSNPNCESDVPKISSIIFKLLEDSKKNEMLNRLMIKLDTSEEDIYKIVSDL